jgi:hypothetical protein
VTGINRGKQKIEETAACRAKINVQSICRKTFRELKKKKEVKMDKIEKDGGKDNKKGNPHLIGVKLVHPLDGLSRVAHVDLPSSGLPCWCFNCTARNCCCRLRFIVVVLSCV